MFPFNEDDYEAKERKRLGIKGELCTCGHLRSVHLQQSEIPESRGHGKCQLCQCPQYTFKRWIR